MKLFFERYADLTALLLTILLPVIVTTWIKTKTGKRTRAFAVWFLVFGPLAILGFIFFHLFENTYRAVSGAINGTFIYNFHFYSLMLLGMVIAGLAGSFLFACIIKCLGQPTLTRVLIFHLLAISLVSAPLLPITPLGAVPLIGCADSSIGWAFAVRKEKSYVEITMIEKQTATG